jgi:hypothetical protein
VEADRGLRLDVVLHEWASGAAADARLSSAESSGGASGLRGAIGCARRGGERRMPLARL